MLFTAPAPVFSFSFPLFILFDAADVFAFALLGVILLRHLGPLFFLFHNVFDFLCLGCYISLVVVLLLEILESYFLVRLLFFHGLLYQDSGRRNLMVGACVILLEEISSDWLGRSLHVLGVVQVLVQRLIS